MNLKNLSEIISRKILTVVNSRSSLTRVCWTVFLIHSLRLTGMSRTVEELDYKNFTVSYIGRYTKRPPLGESRILHVGKIIQAEGIWVTFSYKERNQYPVRWSVPVERFIELLIQHILPDNFRQIRYYGILANRVKTSLKEIFLKLLKRKKYFLGILSWRERQKLYRGYDPLLCPKCGKQMKLVEIATFSQKANSLTYFQPP